MLYLLLVCVSYTYIIFVNYFAQTKFQIEQIYQPIYTKKFAQIISFDIWKPCLTCSREWLGKPASVHTKQPYKIHRQGN